ncbi:MAG TPA: hypothetical protein VKD69_09685 [Vicinamibacterales bacterium]|nr:hypothetical protein [Vicinamibacterales bacterium]
MTRPAAARQVNRRHGAALRLACAALVVAAASCRTIEPDPIVLERNMLTVDNHSAQDWNHVEIWVNTYYRVTKDVVPAHSRFQAPLDTFVAGYGQRFDYRRAMIKDVRLTATLPDGRPHELKKQFDGSLGLAGALGGKH